MDYKKWKESLWKFVIDVMGKKNKIIIVNIIILKIYFDFIINFNFIIITFIIILLFLLL